MHETKTYKATPRTHIQTALKLLLSFYVVGDTIYTLNVGPYHVDHYQCYSLLSVLLAVASNPLRRRRPTQRNIRIFLGGVGNRGHAAVTGLEETVGWGGGAGV